MIKYLIVVVVFFSMISIFVTTLINGIAPVPSSKKVKNKLLEVLPSTPPERIVELGAGWGTLAFALIKKYPHSTVIAYENSLIPYYFLVVRKFLFPAKNLILLRKNFFKENLASSDLIICYLYPGAMNKLWDKFNKELRPGTSIYTHTFSIFQSQPISIWKVADIYGTKIYHYKK